jgi:DNA helicase HerA-like ATPase
MFNQLGILGKTGTGKTYLSVKLVSKYTRLICLDAHNQLNKIGNNVYNIHQFIEKIANKKMFRINCIFENFDDYNLLLGLIWNKLSNITVLIDEVSLFADRFNIDEYLNEIILRGRLKNISLIWNTQRPASINRVLTSQAWNLITFKLTDIRDFAYLAGLPKEQKTEILNLPLRKFIVLGDSKEIEDFTRVKLFLKNEK